MKLSEAIRLLGYPRVKNFAISEKEFEEAHKLLIEAGKLIIQHPTIRFFLQDKLLPGETKD